MERENLKSQRKTTMEIITSKLSQAKENMSVVGEKVKKNIEIKYQKGIIIINLTHCVTLVSIVVEKYLSKFKQDKMVYFLNITQAIVHF